MKGQDALIGQVVLCSMQKVFVSVYDDFLTVLYGCMDAYLYNLLSLFPSLSTYFLFLQFGCGLDEDYYFRLEMHASMFNGMVDVLEEIWTKQQEESESTTTTSTTAAGSSSTTSLLPLQNQGNWEVVYAGRGSSSSSSSSGEDNEGETGKPFRYPGYTRSRDKAGCDTKGRK